MPNYFEIHTQMYKLWPGQIRMEACTMHAHTHIHQTGYNNYVSLIAFRLDKNHMSNYFNAFKGIGLLLYILPTLVVLCLNHLVNFLVAVCLSLFIIIFLNS